jgi:hypothetical protein
MIRLTKAELNGLVKHWSVIATIEEKTGIEITGARIHRLGDGTVALDNIVAFAGEPVEYVPDVFEVEAPLERRED